MKSVPAIFRGLGKKLGNGVSGLCRSLGQGLLVSIVLPAGILQTPSHPGFLTVLALPPHVSVGADDDFGREASGMFYFFSRRDRWELSRLRIEHPMGARDLWRESWASLSIPLPDRNFRVRTSSIGLGHLFLAGEQEGGAPLVRSYQIDSLDGRKGGKMVLNGQVDYFPSAADVAVRTLFLDRKARILWLGYENGRVESGKPYLALADRLLWADPAGYIPLPTETRLKMGPPPLLSPHALLPSGRVCFSCRFYTVPRQDPSGAEIVNHPVRSPRQVDSSMGLLPAGEGLGLFMGRRSWICRIPEKNKKQVLSDCHSLSRAALPVAAVWWANRLAYLFPPGFLGGKSEKEKNRWTIAAINPAFLQETMEKLSSGDAFPLRDLLVKNGKIVRLPPGARPRPQTLSSGGKGDLVLFGKRHIYRMESAP